MIQQHAFQESFWSPNATLDAIPNFKIGFEVLHKKLKQSSEENKVIADYIKQRIAAEKAHSVSLSAIHPENREVFESDVGAGLKRCFEIVQAESDESAKEHLTRAENLHTTALDPLLKFSIRYDRVISRAKKTTEDQINHFEFMAKALEQTKIVYQAKCKALLAIQPEYKYVTSAKKETIKMGKTLNFISREDASAWLNNVKLNDQSVMTHQDLTDHLKKLYQIQEDECTSVIEDFIRLNFLESTKNNPLMYKKQMSKPISRHAESRSLSGFLNRWGNHQSRKGELITEMMEADTAYRAGVEKVDKVRTQTEEALFMHYEEVESLELERIQTIKDVFISMAASLSNTIPRCKETFDNMMLYQETLKPDKDVQFIVEQYRTGRFCPRPILYENYFNGAASGQLFGVSLEEVAKVEGTLVPHLISEGLSAIQSGYSHSYKEEMDVVWTTTLPLDVVHKAREELNHTTITADTLKKYDQLLLSSLIRLYLLELPDCLFTFELYEPCKLVYSTQDRDNAIRITSISKLLTTLPSSNYHTFEAIIGHFHKLTKGRNDSKLIHALSKSFCHILIRPQIESTVNAYERHPQRFIQDLIENYEIIFTKEAHQLQEENSARPSIIIPPKKPSSMDETASLRSANSANNFPFSTNRASVDSSRTRRSSILSFMRSSQSTPTSSSLPTSVVSNTSTRRGPVIPIIASSTLFEDPDEITSDSTATLTPPLSTPSNSRKSSFEPSKTDIAGHTNYMIDELANLDSFFEDEDD